MANSKPTESSISQIQKPDKLLPSVPAGADKLSRRQAIQIATAAVVPSGAILSIPSAAEAGMSSLARSSSETNVPYGGREGPINVKWFGAEGNSDSGGTRGADDTSAIQAALNYIATLHGGTLYFPEGIYKISRNPMYFSFLFLNTATFLYLPSVLLLIIMLYGMIVHHFIILSEEKYLEKEFGNEYLRYKTRVPRYI
jgi:hypothetical protein